MYHLDVIRAIERDPKHPLRGKVAAEKVRPRVVGGEYSPLDPGFPIRSLRDLVRESGWKTRYQYGYWFVTKRGKTLVLRKTERAALRAALVNYGPFYSTAR